MAVGQVGGTNRLLRPDQRPLARDPDCDAFDLDLLGISGDVVVGEAPGAPHEVDDHLVRHPDDRIPANVLVLDLVDCVIGQDAKRTANQADVLGAVVDQQIDVLGGPGTTVSDDREAPDQDVARARLVQRATDPDEIVDLRRASVRAIVWFSQASASSKLPKR